MLRTSQGGCIRRALAVAPALGPGPSQARVDAGLDRGTWPVAYKTSTESRMCVPAQDEWDWRLHRDLAYLFLIWV